MASGMFGDTPIRHPWNTGEMRGMFSDRNRAAEMAELRGGAGSGDRCPPRTGDRGRCGGGTARQRVSGLTNKIKYLSNITGAA